MLPPLSRLPLFLFAVAVTAVVVVVVVVVAVVVVAALFFLRFSDNFSTTLATSQLLRTRTLDDFWGFS